MKPSDEIFQLVKAMSAREKLFFRKKYIQLIEDSDNNYLNLFNEIVRQADSGEEYDESKVKSGEYSGKFIKNLPFHKNFLYNLLLNSLVFSGKDLKASYQVRNLMTQAEILSEKLLHEQSMKLIQKAKKVSADNDYHSLLYQIMNTEKIEVRYTSTAEEAARKIEQLLDEQMELVELMKNAVEFYRLNEKVGIFLRIQGSGKVRGKNTLDEFERIFDTPLLKNIESARSFLQKYIFHNLNLQYHLTKENFKDAHGHAKSAVELCENNLGKLQSKPDNYVFALSNLANTEIRVRKFAEFEQTMEKMGKLHEVFPETLSNSNKVFIFYSMSVLRLSMYMESSDTGRLKSLAEETKLKLPEFEEGITVYQRIILYYFLSTANFMLENFENCLHWNGRIFNLGKTDLSEDYQCYARLIQLISFYELGYIDSLEYALKSAYHFISRKKKVYKYESIIQKYLRKSFRITTEKELKSMFVEMKDEIVKLQKDPLERNAFDAFNILYWLDSKIRGVPLGKVIGELSK